MKRQQKVFEPKTGKSTATSQIRNLIGRMRKNKRAERAARSLESCRSMQISTFAVLMTI